MAPQLDLWLDDDDISTADQSGSFAFVPPSDAATKGNLKNPLDDKAKATWQQTMQIAESKMYEVNDIKDKKGNTYEGIVIEVVFQVAPDAVRPTTGEPDPNAGRQQTVWYRVVPAALKNKVHPKYAANNFALGQTNGILRSIWGSNVFPKGAKVNLSEYFSAVDGTVAVVGQTVNCTVKQSRYSETGKLQDQFMDFVPAELRGA